MSAALHSDLRGTSIEFPKDHTIAEIFAEQVARTPDRIALIASNGSLTYRELDARANAMAHRLQTMGVMPDTLVGVAVDRRLELVVAMLAILKAGGAYVPIDPAYPAPRVAAMLEDSAMPVLVADQKTKQRFSAQTESIAVLDADVQLPQPVEAVQGRSAGDSLAYVIYTSGSTGKPKGVMVEHRNVLNFFAGMDQLLGTSTGVWLAVTSVSFDISILEIFWTLTRGFTVVLHRDDGTTSMAEQIERHGVTHLQMTPSLARILLLDTKSHLSLGRLKQLLLGGEALPAALAQQLRIIVTGRFWNMYGPTETTIWSTASEIVDAQSINIGKPIANTQVCLLNDVRQVVAQGEAGELYIGGSGVVRGYWRRPEMTADRFIVNPAIADGRIYRTGDIARCTADGSLEFLGRVDDQIKLRGHRIELGEIESALEQEQDVRQAVVVLREDRVGDARLVAYLVANDRTRERAQQLRTKLSSQLPEIMVPSMIEYLDTLPLTDNGKINRKALLALPAPGAMPPAAPVASNSMEAIICAVWQDALGGISVGLDDNFFDVGAHSLTVAEVHAQLQQQLARTIALVDLYQYTTIRSLANYLSGAKQDTSMEDRAARRRAARGR